MSVNAMKAGIQAQSALNNVEQSMSGGGGGNGDIESGGAGGGGEGGEGGGKKPLKSLKESTIAEKASAAVAVGAVGTSVTAMVLEQTPLIYAAGGTSSVIAPYSVYQQTRLTDIAALKETHAELKGQVDHLENENQRLKKSVTELNETVERLEDVEQALDLITNTQNQSVAAFAEQVKENREILKQMQKNLKANVLQNLLSVIIRSDLDGDFSIDDDEIDALIRRMQNINGVTVHEDRFRAAIKRSGGSLHDVIEVVKNLLKDDVSREECIFELESPTPENE